MSEGVDFGVVAIIAGALAVWTMVSGRLERKDLSAPIVFVFVGLLVANNPLTSVEFTLQSESFRQIAEVALAVVLFSDAASIDTKALRRDVDVPARLLGLALPLTVVVATVTAHLLFPGTSWWVCAVLGAAVAPTDAALGAAIMENESVPADVRRELNVESGLNDGIATPLVLYFLAAAVAGSALELESREPVFLQLMMGLFGGAVIGGLGGWGLAQARSRGWAAESFRGLGSVALAVLSYAWVTQVGGNGFVAAFLAGLAHSAVTARCDDQPDLDFSRRIGVVLSLLVWFAFGVLSWPILRAASWRDVVFALLALTVLRMGPVALALFRSGYHRSTVALIGWFGPRGLASIVFALLAVDALPEAAGETVAKAITMTVLFSVVLHGISARPLANRYAASRNSS